MKRTRTIATLFLVPGLCSLAAGQSGMVHFKGTVTVAEQHEVVPVCYGSYFVKVGIEEVIKDDETLLGDVTSVEVCYVQEKGLKAGDRVEVYGIYYKGPGECPTQYCTRVIIFDDPYYIRLLAGHKLYVLTQSGILAVSTAGTPRMLIDAHYDSYAIEVRDNTLYTTSKTHGGDIVAYDLQGHYLKTIPTPSQAQDYLTCVALPGERFALLDNANDKVFFIDDEGHLLATAKLRPVKDGSAQNVDGVVVGNRLIVSEDGSERVMAIDLTTYEISVFKDLSASLNSLLAITYASGKYYICGPQAVYSFTTEPGSLEKVAEIADYNITGIVVLGDTAYITVNFAGKIYKVDLMSGITTEITTDLDYPLDIECAVETGCFEVCMPVSQMSVPDHDLACWTFREPWFMSLPPKPTWAPEGAVVTKVQYKLAIRGASLRCSDYEVSLDNDPCDTNPGVVVYDNLGGFTDGGYDDDPETDRDIELDWRETHAFDGQSVHQDWTVCVADTVWAYSGYVTDLCLRICWEVKEAAGTCCGFAPGDRVVLLTDNPDGAVGLPAGTEGTVICCDSDNPLAPVFVSWDGWTNGYNKDQHCDAAPLPYTPYSGWWVGCDDVEAATNGGGGCLADLEAWVPMFWDFTPLTLNICASTQKLEVTYALKNSGCADSGNFDVCFYASKNQTITTSDHLLYQIPKTSMAPGQNGSWKFWVWLAPGELAPGKYYIGCIIDCEGAVQEDDESNNVVVIEDQQLTIPTCP